MRSPAVTHTVNFGVCHSHSPSWPSQNKTAWLWLLTVPSGYKAPLELGQEERKHNNPIMMNELIKDRGEKKLGHTELCHPWKQDVCIRLAELSMGTDLGTWRISFLEVQGLPPCAALWGRQKAEMGAILPPTPGRTVASAWSLLNIRGMQSVLHLCLPTVTLEHLLPRGSAPWQEALGLLFPYSKPGNWPRDFASVSFLSPV